MYYAIDSYPNLIKSGVRLELEQERGLQVCKDAVLVGCLNKWHNRFQSLDFLNAIQLTRKTKKTICR